jgi:hypothetical protein
MDERRAAGNRPIAAAHVDACACLSTPATDRFDGHHGVFFAFGQMLFFNANFNYLVFNANITDLNGGALNADQMAEGSGNLFWLNVLPWD